MAGDVARGERWRGFPRTMKMTGHTQGGLADSANRSATNLKNSTN